jgi:hypothetical protein
VQSEGFEIYGMSAGVPQLADELEPVPDYVFSPVAHGPRGMWAACQVGTAYVMTVRNTNAAPARINAAFVGRTVHHLSDEEFERVRALADEVIDFEDDPDPEDDDETEPDFDEHEEL